MPSLFDEVFGVSSGDTSATISVDQRSLVVTKAIPSRMRLALGRTFLRCLTSDSMVKFSREKQSAPGSLT